MFPADDCQNKYDQLFIVWLFKKKVTTTTTTTTTTTATKTKSKQEDETRERGQNKRAEIKGMLPHCWE